MTPPDRPFIPQRPHRPPLLRMQWRHLLFMHWPAPAETLRPLIPAELEIDQFDGSAWVGLIPFTMRNVLPAIIPRLPGISDIPTVSAFHECNVRTYVLHQGQPGVWFFSLDAASRLAVWGARRFFHLPYFLARMDLKRHGDEIHYQVDRVATKPLSRRTSESKMRCAWRAGERLAPSQPGDIAHFLTERYMLYSANSKGESFRSRIWHDPWPLRSAELHSLDDGLVKAAGIDVDQSQAPLLHHADGLNVQAWGLEGVQEN